MNISDHPPGHSYAFSYMKLANGKEGLAFQFDQNTILWFYDPVTNAFNWLSDSLTNGQIQYLTYTKNYLLWTTISSAKVVFKIKNDTLTPSNVPLSSYAPTGSHPDTVSSAYFDCD